MEFGFSLPSRGQPATMQNMRLLAQHVEALGLDSVWVSDHIIVPRQIDSFYPYDPDGRFPSAPDQAYYEPLTTLGVPGGVHHASATRHQRAHLAVPECPPHRQNRLHARCALRWPRHFGDWCGLDGRGI